MKTFIAYKTRNGASKKYADWLAEKHGTTAIDFDEIDEKNIAAAKNIYVISGTYGGVMPLTDFVRSRWDNLKNKNIILIAVGMAPEDNWWSRLSYFMIPGTIKKNVKYYKLPGLMPNKIETEKNVKESNLDRVK